jgi:20S proteasome alpha/beta subunit
MSMRGDIARSVLDKAVKFDMPLTDAAELIQHIFNNLEWDADCPYTKQDLIDLAKFSAVDKYSSCDKDAYNKWINKYQ